MGFTVGKNAVTQTTAAAATIGVISSPDLSDHAVKWLTIALTVIQGVLAILAHFRTPDGEKIGPPKPQVPPADL